MVDVIPALLPTIGSLSHVYARVRHVDKLRDLLKRIRNDWKLRKTRYELSLMHEHAEASRLFSLFYFILQYIIAIGYNTWLFLPDILDAISPMNESRPRIQPFKAEFFIDEERYSSLTRSHTCMVIFIVPMILLANSTLFMLLSQHACGMCEMLGFIGMIEIYHTVPFLLDVLGFVLSVSLALAQMLTIAGDIERAFRSTSVSVVSLMYLFIFNYMGQRITDASSSICEKV
ncbi:PREDICTED: uncharacterized protein LOC105451802 [Wasmannia auropunctata]|uniref:uncharacterized protein LOC105451802 n=1 Tax=Wasmannia auropunctata TaxID=64793 RepID=UPI0005EDD292|nr:PREDICTED: uncharacterized protein LOC105451802 [Wasmannia auropunctata]